MKTERFILNIDTLQIALIESQQQFPIYSKDIPGQIE